MSTHPRPRSLVRAGVALALLLALTLALGVPRSASVSADEENGCDPNEPVACLDVPEETEGGQTFPGMAPSAAAPAPVPPGRCPPILIPERPSASAAAPIPVPPGCSVRDVFASVNRANVLYRQALMRLDGNLLTSAWGGEALSDLLGQIAVLRANDRYGDPSLLSINLVEMSVNPGRARVRTHEHWTYRERSRFSGEVLVEQDQWVQNIYEMQVRGGSWVVMRDIITFISPQPTPPPPPLPRPRPIASARVTIDRDVYDDNDTVRATITNTGTATLSAGGGQYPCGPLMVERLGDNGWEPMPVYTFIACPAIAQIFPPGQSFSYSIPAGQPGVYRLSFKYSAEGAAGGVANSPPYVVH